MRKRVWLMAAAVALLAVLAWAFAPRPVAVEAASVTEGGFETVVEDEGKTRLRDQYLVSAPLAGVVSRIALREGDLVAQGAVVASLRPASPPLLDVRTRREQEARLEAAHDRVRAAEAAAERARVAVRRARHDADRTAELARSGFVAPARLESDQLAALAASKELDSAIAQRAMAVHDAEQTRAALQVGAGAAPAGAAVPLRAPVAGQVLRVLQTSEATVALGAPLLELGDLRQLEVVAELLTSDALQCRPGSPVRIERWGGPALRGRVRRIEPAGFTKISALGVEEQRVRVLIDLLDGEAARQALGVGYRVNVRIVTLRLDHVRKAPLSALFPLPGDAGGADSTDIMGLYAVREGRARLTRVRVGARNELEAWIRDGPAPGEAVIVYPPAEVRDGVRVQVRSVVKPR